MASREELTQRASELVPLLRERSELAEQQRGPLTQSIQDLQAAELIRMAQPKRFGGLGLDFDSTFDIAVELGRGCASTAWCYSIWSSHNWIVGMFSSSVVGVMSFTIVSDDMLFGIRIRGALYV